MLNLIRKEMITKLVIKNPETGKYFTNDRECWWSRELSSAVKFDEMGELEACIESRRYDFNMPFEDVTYLQIETIIKP